VWAIARCIRRGHLRPIGELIAAAVALAWHRAGGARACIRVEYALRRAGIKAKGCGQVAAIRLRWRAEVVAIRLKHWLRRW